MRTFTEAPRAAQRSTGDRAARHLPQTERDDPETGASLPGQPRSMHEAEVDEVPPIVHEVLRTPGQPLNPETREFMEARFGHDFRRVRVHSDDEAAESAQAIGAAAFTIADHIVFSGQRYSPQSAEGRRILAHELTHAIQQGPGSEPFRTGSPMNRDMDEQGLEREASENAGRLMSEAMLEVRGKSPTRIALDEDPSAGRKKGSNAPRKEETWPEPVDVRAREQLMMDPRTWKIGPATIRFLGKGSDFSDGKPKENLDKAEQLVLGTIKNVIRDLENPPERPYEYTYGGKVSKQEAERKAKTEAQELMRRDKVVRARLMESFRESSRRPLLILIATDLTVAEKMSLTPLAASTYLIDINPKDTEDASRLQACIRIPLVALFGGERGFRPGGKHGWERLSQPPLTEPQIKEVMMHESVHALLLNRNASALQIWDVVGPGMVTGPPEAREACNNLMRRYLRAQEEVFVFTHVGELYSAYLPLKAAHEKFIGEVDQFLASITVRPEGRTTIKLEVGEKVDKRNVPWDISYKYPKAFSVKEAHLDQLRSLVAKDIGT
jgi:hypothetical protein